MHGRFGESEISVRIRRFVLLGQRLFAQVGQFRLRIREVIVGFLFCMEGKYSW